MTKPLTEPELAALARQLAMLLHSGISTLEGISILRDDAASDDGRGLLTAVYEQLETTGELAASMRETELFPEYFLKMTEIGERSGTLEEVMASLADHYERQNTMMRSIRDSLTYPMILIGMLSAVLVVLITQVMPVFEKVFAQLGLEMSGVSALVFRIGHLMQGASAGVIIVLIALVLGCMIGIRSPKGRSALISAAMHLPAARTISQLLACSHFSDALSLALHSGLDMGESFTLAAGLTEQSILQDRLLKAQELIDQGADVGESLRETGIFTGLNARMVSIGFRTGSAETALKQISIDCQREADDRLQRIIGALEPTLTAVLSVLTGLILVSVMLPLLGVMTNIG